MEGISEMSKENVSHCTFMDSFDVRQDPGSRELGLTCSVWELSSNTLLQDRPSWLTVTENSVTIIWVNRDRAPWVMTPVMRLTFPKSTCSHSWGLSF